MKLRVLILAIATFIAQGLFAQQNCNPTDVEITPASCSGVNDGMIEVTPPSNCEGEGCFTGTPTPIENCSSCSRSVSGTNGATISNGQKVCVQPGRNLSGNLTFSGGGTLVVCGTANLQNINLNGSGFRRIIVLGSLTITSMNMGGMEIHNYGNINITQGLSVEGLFNNYGTVSVTNHFNINASNNGRMYNYGALNVGTDMNDLNIFENRGTVSVGNNLTLNSPTAMLNTCQVTVGRDFTINSATNLDQRGIITVGGVLRLNNNSTIFMKGSTRITAGSLAAGGTLLQHNGGAGCSLLHINGSSNLNAPITFSGNLSFCPSGGFQTGTRPTYTGGAQESCTACTPPTIPPSGAIVTWTDFGITGPVLNNVPPGTYAMELTCGTCTYTDSYTVGAEGGVSVTIVLGTDGQSLTADVGGDPSGFTFEWTSSNGTDLPDVQTITGLTPGTYTVTVTDAGGCSDTEVYTINPESCNPTFTQSPISCFGANDGSVTVGDLGCAGGEVFWIDFGMVGNSISNLSEGTYLAKVSCGTTCLDTLSFTFVEPDPLELLVDVDPSGLISLTATGGTGTYTFSWTDVDGNIFVQSSSAGLIAGDYDVKVVDQNECEDGDEVTVTMPSCAEPEVEITHMSCNVTVGELEVNTSTLCENFFIAWTNNSGTVVGSDPVLVVNTAGNYTLTVECEGNCSFTKTYTVNADIPLSISAVAVGNGADLTITGGTAPYMVQWTNGIQLVSTEQDPDLLPAGVNTALVMDVNGCSAETDVTVNTTACDPDAVITPVTCNESTDGSIEIIDTGCEDEGTGDCEIFYELRARGDVGDEQVNFRVAGATIATFNLSTTMQSYFVSSYLIGTIDVEFFNDDSNTVDRNVQIDYVKVDAATLQAENQSVNTGAWNNDAGACGMANSEWLHCNGRIEFGEALDCSDDGGSGCDVTYELRARGTNGQEQLRINVGGQAIATFTMQANNYQNFTVTSAVQGDINVEYFNDGPSGGDVKVDYLKVADETRQAEAQSYNTASWNNSTSSCGKAFSEDMHCDGIIGFGNTPTCDNGGGGGTACSDPVSPGPEYQCNSCTQTLQGNNLNVTVNSGNKICIQNGSSVSNMTFNGNGTVVICGNVNISNATFGNGGTMSVIGTANFTGSVNFNSPGTGKLRNFGTVNIPSNLSLNGFVYNYGTMNIQQTLNINDNNGTFINHGTLSVGQSLNNNEVFENYGTVTVGTNPNTDKIHLNSGSNTINACTMSTVGELLIDASSTLEYRSYISVGTKLTLNGSSSLVLGGAKIEVQDFTANSSVIQIDNGNCSLITVAGNSNLQNMTFNGEISYCDATIEQEINVQWINGAGKDCVCDPDGDSDAMSTSAAFIWAHDPDATGPIVTGLGKGTYSVTINCNSCYSVHEFEVTGPEMLVATATVSSTGQVTLTVEGGTPGYTYTWTSDSGTTLPNDPNPVLTEPGVYTVTVTDSNGCTTTTTVTYNIPLCSGPAPVVSIKHETCFGSTDGTITITDPMCSSTGDGTLTYTWIGPDGTVLGNTSSITDLTPGIYQVNINCGGACVRVVSYEVLTLDPLNPKIVVTSQVSCSQEWDGALAAHVEGGSGSYIYQWSDTWKNLGGNEPTLTGLLEGIYYLDVTDAENPFCTAKQEIYLSPGAESCPPCENLKIEVYGSHLTCASEPTGYLEAVVSGGSGNYTYLWSTAPPQTTALIENLDAGWYSVKVTDVNSGEQCYKRVGLHEPDPIAVDIVVHGGTEICEDENEEILLEARSAKTLEYLWSPDGQVENYIVVNRQGTYMVTGTDVNGCIAQKSVTITAADDCDGDEPGGCDMAITFNKVDLSCFGSGDGRVEAVVTGASDDLTFVWFGGTVASDGREIVDLDAGTYTVSVTDNATGCVRVASVTVDQPNQLDIQITGNDVLCVDGDVILSATGSPGNYTWFRNNLVIDGATGQNITVSNGGTYQVEVRDGLCVSRSNDFILSKQPDNIDIHKKQSKICPGDSLILSASQTENIIWSTGETTPSIIVKNEGTYTVSIQFTGCPPTSESFDLVFKSAEECADPTICEIEDGIPVVLENPCIQDAYARAEAIANDRFKNYIDAQRKDFERMYVEQCIKTQENLTIDYIEREHHYTLFYYDLAGNLVRTVPPQGISMLTPSEVNQVQSERQSNTRVTETAHDYMTTYTFNSNNTPVTLGMPDQDPVPGEKYSQKTWYDELGRLVLTQSSYQFNQSPQRYQYVIYDELGREKENGEVRSTSFDLGAIESSLENRVIYDDLVAELNGEIKYEVHRNYYDSAYFAIPNFGPEHLRNRLASATYEVNDSDNDPNTYDHAVHYSYDIHGNVKMQVTDNPSLDHLFARYKTLEYIYDLVSQNVLEVHYQKNSLDQYFYRNEYDADNRLVQVWTSKDYIHWDREIKHFFYHHGPLARTEIGHEKVQGMDYAYTIHGWTKVLNSNTLLANRDMGKDGQDGGLHRFIPQDEMGYSLGFYQGDYSSISSIPQNDHFLINTSGSELDNETQDLYNGNITNMMTSIRQFMQNGEGPLAQSFKYDQLNRLKESRVFEDPNSQNANTWAGSGTASDKYKMRLTYDANGNIMTLKRNAHTSTTPDGDGLDDLVYYYENKANGYSRNTNRLIGVEDQRDHSGDVELDKIDDIRPGQIINK